MATKIPLQKMARAQFAVALKLFADCVHTGTFQDAFGTKTENIPLLFAGVPAFGLNTSGITRSDVMVFIRCEDLPADHVLANTEHFYYQEDNKDFYYGVVCGATDPTHSYWCIFGRPAEAPK